jgi:hypothetical protein
MVMLVPEVHHLLDIFLVAVAVVHTVALVAQKVMAAVALAQELQLGLLAHPSQEAVVEVAVLALVATTAAPVSSS